MLLEEEISGDSDHLNNKNNNNQNNTWERQYTHNSNIKTDNSRENVELMMVAKYVLMLIFYSHDRLKR